jgi:DNA-binding beta-propeller fold protein YncE
LLLSFETAVVGCQRSDVGPQLDVREVHQWAMPPHGSSVPAPRDIAAGPQGDIYVLDNAGRVLVFEQDGKLVRQWWMPEYDVGKPEDVHILRDGRIAVADTHYHRIVFFNAGGEVLSMHGQHGAGPGEFEYPVAVEQDASGHYYVGEYGGNDRIQKFTEAGEFVLQFGSNGTGAGQFQRPSGLVWHDGELYVADAINNRIQVFSDTGTFLNVLSGDPPSLDLQYPYELTLGPDGHLFAVEYKSGRVSKFDLSGSLLGQFGTTGTSKGQFRTPWGLAVDAHLRVYVADTGNRRVVVLEP